VSGDRYASVPERITWTTGFRLAIDKHVLGALSTFANFRTGKHADMKLGTLVKRAKVSRSTVLRSLQRLIEDDWVFAKKQHRRPTIYDINEARLATHWMEAKLVEPLSVTGDTQERVLSVTGDTQEETALENLSVTGDTQERVLSVTGDTQERVLSVTGDTPSPVRSDPLYILDHKEPALRAVPSDDSGTPTPTLVVDSEAKVDTAKVDRAPPQQLAFGPQEMSTKPIRDPNWTQRFADTIRSALRQTAERKKDYG
jgi:hypothetical protein